MPNIKSQQGCAGIRDQCSDRDKGDVGTQVREKNFQNGRKAVITGRAEKKERHVQVHEIEVRGKIKSN
jgi:hypothetical protein